MSIKSYIKRGLTFMIKGQPEYHTTAIINCITHGDILKGKRIIVTGGGRGLGFSMAKKFSNEGAIVLIAGRNEETLKKSAENIHCYYSCLDIKDIESFDDFIKRCDDIMGGIDCLVNNAGISLHESSLSDVTPDTFDAQIETNFRGPYFLTQKFTNYILKSEKKGNVLFISSETGDTMDFRPYGFSKAAVNSMVQGLAYLFRKSNIRVNAVAPGITASNMTGIDKEGNLYAGDYGSGRFYMPEEVAETASFLLSDLSGCISGQIITCNNAQTINARWK